MDNIKVTLTPSELSDIIDLAFDLGKIYASDELESTGAKVFPRRGGEGLKGWDEYIEENGGVCLNSGDAKLDILWNACAMKMRDSLKSVIDY